MVRVKAWLTFHFAEFSTFAAAIAYQLMIVFFPGILLIKALKDIFGIPNIARFQPVYAEIDMPGSIVSLVNGFLKSAKGLTGFSKPVATAFLLFLVLLGLSRVFTEYYNASLLLFGRDKRLLRDRIVSGIASVLVVSAAVMLFLALNGSAFARQPHILRDYGFLIAVASTFVSIFVLVASIAALFHLVSHGRLTPFAIWIGSSVTVSGWIADSFVFLQLDFYFAMQQSFYGAGAAIVAMLVWFYLTASLLLLGLGFSHFVIDGRSGTRQRPMPSSTDKDYAAL
jgi:membrane protein